MKKSKAASPLTAPPDTSSADTDAVIDDLNQQDVLPADEGDVIREEGMPDDDAITQAGSWDDPAADLGHRVAKQPLEDEVKASEDLVNMGVDEADEELREADEDEEEKVEKEDGDE